MVSRAAADRVQMMIDDAVKRGAQLVLTPERKGCTLSPAIVAGGPAEARLLLEEAFGPVVIIISAANLNDALNIANASEFGLQGACFTQSLDTAFKVSRRFHVGSLWINEASRFRLDTYPFGGVGASGFGREGVRYAMEEMSQWKFAESPLKRNAYMGTAVPRLEDFRFLTGRGIYAGDLYRDALLHAVIVRSPIAHGRLRQIDAATAKIMPGVVAVITAQDIGTNIPRIPMRQEPMPELTLFEQPVISTDTVRYVGEPVAMVLAESAAAAEDAAAAVVPDIEPLPVVLGPGDEVLLFDRAGSNIAARIRAVRGDAAAAFANHRGYTRREKFFVHRHTAVALEPRCLLAEWENAARQMTLYGAAKVPFHRRILARFLGLPEQNVICIENDVGGAFGTRGEFYPEDFLIPFAARLTGRPVKWVEDRRENLLATNHAREAGCELEIACASDGRIVALGGEAFSDIGAYISRRRHACPQYRTGAVRPIPDSRYRHLRLAAIEQQNPCRYISRTRPLRGGFLP